MFSSKDLQQIKEKGISIEQIGKQIHNFLAGFPYIQLAKPATPGDGIFLFSEEEADQYISIFQQGIGDYQVIKFVPASGAATRMFKHLFEFAKTFVPNPEGIHTYLQSQDVNSVHYFMTHINRIAFYHVLENRLSMDHSSVKNLIKEWRLTKLIDYILTDNGLNYGNLPKGLLLFHQYPEGARTAAEEHLVEAAHYAKNRNLVSRIHFTISPEHLSRFQELFNRVIHGYEAHFGVHFEITFSEQLPSTDTIAVDEQNQPFRTSTGTLLFRPGGHGSLLYNLQRLDADLIFIKNIDNIVPDRLKEPTIRYKMLIGGYLIYMMEYTHRFLRLASEGQLEQEALDQIALFAKEKLGLSLPPFQVEMAPEEIQAWLFSKLNRPMRVCGMVRNEGEPGGGPFWVNDHEGNLSLQIVESTQIDMTNGKQLHIVNESTHFNPVDLVCCIKDYRGDLFDLSKFVDEKTGFISSKSSEGKKLKALERPGLWNGAMANWITVFIEVPVITFNPVKTVNDLLRKEHLE